jgi:TonB family protein
MNQPSEKHGKSKNSPKMKNPEKPPQKGKKARRRFSRYRVQAPMDVTVLRSGIPDTLPGRTLNLGEQGISALLSGELKPGEFVGVEVRLPMSDDPLRTRALVRYHDRLRCGMEFVGLSIEQKGSIRDWVKRFKAQTESGVTEGPELEHRNSGTSATPPSGGPMRRRRARNLGIAFVVVAVLVAASWWRWNRNWKELESGLSTKSSAQVEPAQTRVSAQEMEKLLLHRVEPEYPQAARQAGLQGVIALQVIVGRNGDVLQLKPLNGPDVLARSAMDALRWWRFAPYRIDGEPVVVETTLAVEFKL